MASLVGKSTLMRREAPAPPSLVRADIHYNPA